NVRGPVYNAYGPTEFTVDATYFELEKGKDYASIPIGRPVSNAWAFVCDTYGHLLPQGMAGELCLAGSQLAEGYWKQPELTAKSFVDCSFLPGQKMYRTGDLARYNEEGQLEYLGRIDTQVKLRGFRIEMGEIENRAGQFEGVEYVAAAVKKEQLVLYYTSKEGTVIDREELRRFLSETLTDYMVPTAYMPLSVMPMTPSGKIDRKALPEPEWKGSEYVAPVSETERALAEAFGEILGIREKIGASEDFFLLGGDSIKAIRLVSRLRERGIRVSVSDIMSQKTVRGIASQVKQSKETAPSQEPYEGQVPDTAIVSFFKDLALPEPWHYNQCLLLAMRERGVLPALQKAMDALAFQHDLLRAVWRAQASHHAPAPALAHPARRPAGANVASRSCASVGAKQSHHAPAPTLAHSCASEEHLFVRDSGATLAIEEYQAASEEEITKICNDIQSHIQMEEALVRVALIHGREKDYLFIAAHHLVVDGVSWRILASDLERAYGAALLNNPIQFPEKSHTYRDYAEALQRYRDSYALRQEIPYWKATEGKMKGLPLSKAKDYSRSFEKLVVAMDKEGTAKFLRGEFEKIRGDVNDALLTAVGRSFAKVQGVTAVSFQMEGHGRENFGETLLTDRTVGWFTSI
ncbi:MAG: AMP-binding protein, partial [Selenomonadaceae bacterium]|nr:AMP-binding protein [Selenomonadaceae bacterium]